MKIEKIKCNLKIGEQIVIIKDTIGNSELKMNKIYIVEYIHEYVNHIKLVGFEERIYQSKLFSNDIRLIRKIKIEELNEQ